MKQYSVFNDSGNDWNITFDEANLELYVAYKMLKFVYIVSHKTDLSCCLVKCLDFLHKSFSESKGL